MAVVKERLVQSDDVRMSAIRQNLNFHHEILQFFLLLDLDDLKHLRFDCVNENIK